MWYCKRTFIDSRKKYHNVNNECIKGEKDEYRSSLVPETDSTDKPIL